MPYREQRHHEGTITVAFLGTSNKGGQRLLVVKHFENNGHPDGRGARMGLERIHGRREVDERPAQLLALEGKGGEARRGDSVSNIPGFFGEMRRDRGGV